jgi:UPF0271 protein
VTTGGTVRVDLNSDLGEGFGHWSMGDDEAVVAVVSSANVACGFHAGDPPTMARVCRAAVERGVAVGAQVGYRDLAGFGRRHLDVDARTLADEVLYQVGALDAMARAAGGRVSYVKPHGALYTAVTSDVAQAAAVVDAVRAFGGDLPVVGLPGSQLLTLAERAGLRPVAEAFADRAYTADGRLRSRKEPDALVTDADEVAARCVRMVVDGEVTAVDGSVVAVRAESICVHGDTDGAVALATRVRAALEAVGVEIAAFARR